MDSNEERNAYDDNTYDDSLRRIEEEDRKQVLSALALVPRRTPHGWKRFDIVVGNLEYVGFSEHQPEMLVCISSQYCSIINCRNQSVSRREMEINEVELTAVTDALPGEIIRLAGIGGGGLRFFNRAGDSLVAASPDYPKSRIIFQPAHSSFFVHPRACSMIFEEYEIRAYGFSKCGNYMAAACAGGVTILARLQNWAETGFLR